MAEPAAPPRTLRAPAKINLGLRVGERDGSGLHPIRSLFCPLELSDRLIAAEAETDEVICPGVQGENLADAALRALRQAGWRSPPLRIEIDKRIPIAAGLGGGSADAAAVLRLAAGEVESVAEIAFSLGSDVPSQLTPTVALVSARGEVVDSMSISGSAGVVLIPSAQGLAAADVYARADELGSVASDAALDEWEGAIRAELASGTPISGLGELLANDLEAAARSLRPELGEALTALREAGAAASFVCGSGPTIAGLFADLPAADAAASSLSPRWAGALVTALDPAPVLP